MSENNNQNQDQNPLQVLLEQIDCLPLGQLWTGLTILAKDMTEFLAVGAYDTPAVNTFRRIYISALNEDRAYWECYGYELYMLLCEIEGVPFGFAKRAKDENYDIAELLNPDLIKEWTRYPGWELLKQSSLALKDAVCREDSDLDAIGNGSNGSNGNNGDNGNNGANGNNSGDEEDDCPEEDKSIILAKKILKYSFEDEPFWYPIAVYIAHLLVRTGYEHLCLPVTAENGNLSIASATTG